MIARKIRHQRGIILIQVLLITAMLIILVVQLSKDARRQVQTAILLKNKSSATLAINDTVESLKFQLLITPKGFNNNIEGYNFFGETVTKGTISVTGQDEHGLLSLPYPDEVLKKVLDNDALLAELERWQGTGDMEDARNLQSSEVRGGMMPSKNELESLAGWDKAIDKNDMTHLPTKYFNLYNSPSSLLSKAFSEDVVNQINSLRNGSTHNQKAWDNIASAAGLEASGAMPGKFITVTFQNKEKPMLRKKIRLMLDSNQVPAIAEVAIDGL